MQTKAASKESSNSASRAFFSARASSPSFFNPMIQAKCAACENEVQRKEDPTLDAPDLAVQAKSEPSPAITTVQAQCGACAESGIKLQPKLTLGTPGDRFEQEADQTADVVMRSSGPVGAISAATPVLVQRDAAETCKFSDEKEKEEEDEETEDEESKETKVSPKQDMAAGAPPVDLEERIGAARGGGTSLHAGTRDFMESRFGYDFSDVRIHTGAHSEGMNRDIRSLAFTSGTDIFFASGQYRPEIDSGRHLLAHELTHVVQQSGPRAGNGIVREKADPGQVSRAPTGKAGEDGHAEKKKYYSTIVSGTQVHHELEKILRGVDSDELVTEAAIPGANRNHVKLNNIGVADLYKSTPNKTVAGIKGYRNVESLADLVGMNSPEVNDTRPLSVTSSPHLETPPNAKKGTPRNLVGNFPSEVQIGEIKPASIGKLSDGWAQLDNYTRGYQEFVARINTVSGGSTRATINVKRLKLKLPDEINFDKWDTQHTKDFKPAMAGTRRLWVAEVGDGNGIYLYEDLAAGLKGQPTEWHRDQWPQLLKIRSDLKNIKSTGTTKMGQGKAAPGVPVVQRTDNREQWEKGRKDFSVKFRGALKTNLKDYRDKVKFEKKLGKKGKNLPDSTKTAVKEYKSMMFWSGFGGKVLGRVRFMLGDAWDKGVEIFEKMKKKMHDLRGRVRAMSDSSVAFGWAKRLIKVLVAASKVAVAQFITESFNFFADCFQSAMDKIVEKFQEELLNTELGQKLCRVRKDFLATKEKLDREWGSAIGQLEELFAVIQDVKKWTDLATTLIDLIRVGVQVISCLTPPALGCLWGLVAQVGIGAALGIVVGTQWFNDNIVTPQVRKLVRAYAAPHYQSLINRVLGDNLKEFHCHIADKPFPSMDFTYDEVGIKAGTKEMEDLRATWEKENEGQMIADLQKIMVNKDGTPVTKENLQQIVKVIQEKKLNVGQIKTAVQQARDAGTSKIDPQTLTQQVEQGADAIKATADAQIAKKRNIDYPKATRSNLMLQKMHGWDPHVFYKQPTVKVDSEEFANAVYDIQESMNLKPDGILGNDTLIAFYDRNKLKKDLAYKQSTVAREKARQAAEEAARERARKELEAKGGGGASKGGAGKAKVLDASECKRKGSRWEPSLRPANTRIRISNPDMADFLKRKENGDFTLAFEPTHLTLDIHIDGEMEYRVVNVPLQGMMLTNLLVANADNYWVLYIFLTDGIELDTSKGKFAISQYSWSL